MSDKDDLLAILDQMSKDLDDGEAIAINGQRFVRKATEGCCTACGGTGTGMSSPESNGKCWDCFGTGHEHYAGYDCTQKEDTE